MSVWERFNPLIVLLVAITAGCGRTGPALVPVSGTVTLNDKPLPNAVVSFQPEAATREAPVSDGVTDESGRYKLAVTVLDKPGAIIGKHSVRITAAQRIQQAANDDSIKRVIEPLPVRYNQQSELTFEVPPGGTSKADFALQKP